VAYGTVRAWVQVFEALYHCFLVRPWAKRVARAVRSAPKLYLYDILQLPAAAHGARLENITALHLLKACHFWTDAAFGDFDLRFVRDKERREVDFMVVRDGSPWCLVECKTNDVEPAAALLHFRERLRAPLAFQLVRRPGYDRDYPRLRSASSMRAILRRARLVAVAVEPVDLRCGPTRRNAALGAAGARRPKAEDPGARRRVARGAADADITCLHNGSGADIHGDCRDLGRVTGWAKMRSSRIFACSRPALGAFGLLPGSVLVGAEATSGPGVRTFLRRANDGSGRRSAGAEPMRARRRS
jgi:hypothetical protein